jgi:hypothetical protein
MIKFQIKFVEPTTEQLKQFNWFRRGLFWGIFCSILISLIMPLFDTRGHTYIEEAQRLFMFTPVWILGGLIWGIWTKKGMEKRIRNEKS